MHNMGKTVELHVMLKLAEKGIPKKVFVFAVLAIRGGKIQKKKNKSQDEESDEKIKKRRKNEEIYTYEEFPTRTSLVEKLSRRKVTERSFSGTRKSAILHLES
ncbi:hypothetical protein Tco_0169297 [Tanacetum coccineum]